MAALEKSLERFGVVEPIIRNKRSGNVVGGRQRLKVLRARKVVETFVVVVDLDDVDEKALNVALNSPKLAGEFTAKLHDLPIEIEAERKELFHALRLGELCAGLAAPVGRTDPDDVPNLPEAAPKTKPGDLYLLDSHRLLCGDSTSPIDHAHLLADDRVDALVTDPPYGVDYAGVGGGRKKIANDARSDYREWFASRLSLIAWAPKAVFFVCMSGVERGGTAMRTDSSARSYSTAAAWTSIRPTKNPEAP